VTRTAPEQNKATIERFIEALNDPDSDALDALDALVQPDFVRHCSATAPLTIESLDDFRAFLLRDGATFPDAHMEMGIVIAEGEMVAVQMTLTGTQEGPIGPFPTTGKPVTVPFLAPCASKPGRSRRCGWSGTTSTC
jgi:predicted ester cyclase